MWIDTQTIQPATTLTASTGAMPEQDLDAPAARWVPIATAVLAGIAVVLACGLAVAMNLS